MGEWHEDPRGFLLGLYKTAVASAQPSVVVPAGVRSVFSGLSFPAGRMPAVPATVFGAGKASAAMAQAFEQSWPGPVRGLVVTRYGHAVSCKSIEIVEAAHPVPDRRGIDAAARMIDMARSLKAADLAVCLISGGGSSLLTLPIPGITLKDKQDATCQLLKCGASIQEINTVRKHLSQIKGGRLAAACFPAPVMTLMISDVPGDEPATIASGPTVADPTTNEQAAAILDKYGVDNRQKLIAALAETPKPGNPALKKAQAQIIASPMTALQAAARHAESLGLPTCILSDCIEGDAEQVGFQHAEIAVKALERGQPLLILSGGETTVQVRGNGRGGRNVEFLAAFVRNLNDLPGVYALAADTDGIDGTDEIAGAYADPTTLQRAKQQGLNLEDFRSENDCHTFFERLGDSIVTGPTHTNVNDFRAILVVPA